MIYEIEITRFAPEPMVDRFVEDSSEAAAERIKSDDRVECVVFVAALDRERDVDCGNFWIWCDTVRALIQLNEHREHYASDPTLPAEQRMDVRFRNEDGSFLTVPFSQTVSCAQALAALHFWLPGLQRTPELEWR